jgi:hypothetical protein
VEAFWIGVAIFGAYIVWMLYMMTCRTDDWVKIQEADKDRRQHWQAMQRARFAGQQERQRRRAGIGMGVVKMGVGILGRMLK